ncbi:sugar phosphate permease [Desulfosalsimonas propionicica]|uniref:Sugar phosphate permease n=1 Tax=Desulfosalsimonas propionicica TaxID=332175 RepID=A0A7W0CA68_9BACT|nr:MFS transporter [Desulfosalsimonas propionicica]MBA2882014.1 sugar phosphate permease [Desulfosalsimonas propionicica]
MPDAKIFYGWYIVGACFLLCFLFAGAGFYSFSIFIEPIEKQFGWNRAAISLTMSIYLVTGGLMGPVHGRLIGRFGPRRVMLVCAVGAGACFVLVSLTRWLWYFYLVYALLAATVCGMGVVPVSSLLSNWFDRRRGTATGIALVGISAGGLLLAPMVGLVTAVWGWQTSFVIIGLMVWCIALPVVFFVIRDRPDQLGLVPEGGGRSVYGQAEAGGQTDFQALGRPAGEVLRTRAFWCIFLSFFLAPMAQMGVLQHQVPLIMDTGMSHAYASVALGVTAGVGGLGKLSFGKMADIWPFQYVILLCFGLQILSVLFLLTTQTPAGVWVYAVCFGFSMGGVIVLLPLVVGHFWGLLSYGVLLGVLWVANAFGGATGTFVSGLVYDWTGSYNNALYLFAAAYLVAIAAFFAAGRPGRASGPASF